MQPKQAHRVPLTHGFGLSGLGILSVYLWAAGTRASQEAAFVPTGLPSTPEPAAQVAATGNRVEVPRRLGYYVAPAGTNLRYALDGRVDYAITTASQTQQSATLRLRSSLDLLVVDRRIDEIVVRGQLADLALDGPTLSGQQSQSDAYVTGVREPFLARLSPEGRVLGYRFVPGLNGEQRSFLRGVFSAYMHTVPADAPEVWEAPDSDAAGELVAAFRLLPEREGGERTVERRKLRYVEMNRQVCDQGGPTLAGGSSATFSRALGWLREVRVDEQCTIKLAELGLSTRVHSVMHVMLVGHAVDRAPAQDDATSAADWAAAAGHNESLGTLAMQDEAALWRSRLRGKNLGSLVADLEALLRATARDEEAIQDGWRALSWLVRFSPEVAAAIRLRVLEGTDTRLAAILLSALGVAGNGPAQDALAAIRADSATSAEVRQAATIAMFQLSTPSARVMNELAVELATKPSPMASDPMAVLLLGALAPRCGGVLAGGSSALDALIGLERRALAEGRIDLWLDAMGNAGSREVLGHVRRYVGDGDPQTRGAAYSAVRRVADEAAVATLRLGLGDADPRVRADVAAALAERKEPAAIQLLITAARDDADAAVRRPAVRALARRAEPGSPARAAIADLAQNDPVVANRQLAQKLLASG